MALTGSKVWGLECSCASYTILSRDIHLKQDASQPTNSLHPSRQYQTPFPHALNPHCKVMLYAWGNAGHKLHPNQYPPTSISKQKG